MISFPRALAEWGEAISVTLVVPWYLPTIGSVPCCFYNPVRTLLSHKSKGLGCNPEKFQSNIVNFLLVLKEECTAGGQSIWPFHGVGKPLSGQGLYCGGSSQTPDPSDPHQAQLAVCLSVELNTDAHHAPLPREGYHSILIERGTSSAACGWISQLDICQLLSLASPGCLPGGAQWMWDPCDNVPALSC